MFLLLDASIQGFAGNRRFSKHETPEKIKDPGTNPEKKEAHKLLEKSFTVIPLRLS